MTGPNKTKNKINLWMNEVESFTQNTKNRYAVYAFVDRILCLNR